MHLTCTWLAWKRKKAWLLRSKFLLNDPGLLISDEMLENIIGSEINVKYNGKCATCRNGRCVISMFFEQLSTDEDDDSGDNYDTSDSLCVASLLMRKRKRWWWDWLPMLA